MHNKTHTITIIGGGLAGCFLAILLANRGYKILLYEKLSKQEISDINSKRSYNITFLAYGTEMLKKAGVWDMLKPHLLPLIGASTQLSKDSKPIFSPTYDKKAQYYAVSRASLLEVLLKYLSDNPLVTVHYNTTLVSINRYAKTIIVQDTTTNKLETVSCEVVIGADGANSLVRPFIQQGQHTHHSQEYSAGGYKQFTISKKMIIELGLQSNIAYTWSADKKFILAFPNHDGSLAALLIYPKEKKALASLQSEQAIKYLLQENFPLLSPAYKELAEQLIANPVGGFVTIHTDPWYYKDFLAVVGDAAHGFYPFFGQGTSAAFGDSMKIVTLLDTYGPDWEKIFPLYQEARKRHMDALGELSKEGLTRYARNKRADYDAIYDKLEFVGSHYLPKLIQPPILTQVMNDPEHTADYVENTRKQRTRAKWIGISLAVTTLKSMIALYEKSDKLFKT